MTVVVSDYLNVEQRVSELGLNPPTGLSLLPKNFETAKSREELVQENTTPTVRTLLRQAGVRETKLEKDKETLPYSLHESFDWVAPIIFVTASWLSSNPDLMSNALGVISDYLTDWFKGKSGSQRARLTVVVERTPNKVYKRLDYDGPADQINDLVPAVMGVLQPEPEN